VEDNTSPKVIGDIAMTKPRIDPIACTQAAHSEGVTALFLLFVLLQPLVTTMDHSKTDNHQ